MLFPSKLIKGIILKRYKRFLSDIQLPSGEVICAHVPNTGSMATCWAPGQTAYLSKSTNPKRKLAYTLELIHNGSSYICVNTQLTNKIVKEALELELIAELKGYNKIQPEKTAFDSRLDFYLSDGKDPNAYIEVKNVTLLGENSKALFPDSVTIRGQKHLKDLIKIKKEGLRAVMLYLINRQDVSSFSPASKIDPTYASLLESASQVGVEVLAYQTIIDPSSITLSKKLELVL